MTPELIKLLIIVVGPMLVEGTKKGLSQVADKKFPKWSLPIVSTLWGVLSEAVLSASTGVDGGGMIAGGVSGLAATGVRDMVAKKMRG